MGVSAFFPRGTLRSGTTRAGGWWCDCKRLGRDPHGRVVVRLQGDFGVGRAFVQLNARAWASLPFPRTVICAVRRREFGRLCLPPAWHFEVGHNPHGRAVVRAGGDFRCWAAICAARRKEYEPLCLPPKRHFEVGHDPHGRAVVRAGGEFRCWAVICAARRKDLEHLDLP